LVNKRKTWLENLFLLNVCGFCREKNSKNSGLDGQIFGHLVQPVQLFLDQGLLKKVNFSHQIHALGLGFVVKKIPRIGIKTNPGRDGQDFSHLVRPFTKDLKDHRYSSVLPQ
jgi:hypothetical protein